MPVSDTLNFVEMSGLLVGGLALFLFGLELMTAGLKAVAGARLQALLGRLTAHRLRGVMAGAGVTALLNSSTITTVLLVGFVSAGLMTLSQSIPMIMGANIGSTLTAQLIAFDLSAITPFMLGLGFLMHAFAPRVLLRQLGGILLGFGLLFLGIEMMGNATRPLRTFQPFIDAMQNMTNPLLGILIGAVFTAVVQSSAATLAIVIALAGEGLIPLEASIALVLGANVGTCGTALLAGIGKSAEALQVGVVHLLFNVLGVLFFAFLIPEFADLVRHVSPSSPDLEGVARLAAETPRQVANAHTIFSVTNTLVLIWFTEPIARLARWIAPSKSGPEVPGTPRYLDDALLEVPALGIQRLQLELVRAGEDVLELVRRSARAAAGMVDPRADDLPDDDGEGPDRLAAKILEYIGRLSEAEHSEREGRQLVDLAQIVTRLEGVREIATINLHAIGQRRRDHGVDLMSLRTAEGTHFAELVIGNLERAVQLVGKPDEEAVARILDSKPEIEALASRIREGIVTAFHLRSQQDVTNFRLASDIIEQFNEIARLSRAVARSTQGLGKATIVAADAAAEPSVREGEP